MTDPGGDVDLAALLAKLTVDGKLIELCDATVMREDSARLRHCTRPAGHHPTDGPAPRVQWHSDGERQWE